MVRVCHLHISPSDLTPSQLSGWPEWMPRSWTGEVSKPPAKRRRRKPKPEEQEPLIPPPVQPIRAGIPLLKKSH